MAALGSISSVRSVLLMRWRTSTTLSSDSVLRMKHCLCLCMTNTIFLHVSVLHSRARKPGSEGMNKFMTQRHVARFASECMQLN